MNNKKIEKALEYYNKKEYQKAIDVFSSVLETCQDNAELYNNIALCYANLGDDEKAEKYYLKAEELNPKLPQIYINLADIYYRQREMWKGCIFYNVYSIYNRNGKWKNFNMVCNICSMGN